MNILKVVPEAGLEPARYFYRGILSPLCLPIPPLGQVNRYLKASIILSNKIKMVNNIQFFLCHLQCRLHHIESL